MVRIISFIRATIREALGYENSYGDVGTCMVAFTSLMFIVKNHSRKVKSSMKDMAFIMIYRGQL